ncbi:MAG: hypothetical protein K9L26_05000 [Candidatus Izimaplasma sp.]|nr:hypothetical protein [Candidatus Izimaplasma bacterium]
MNKGIVIKASIILGFFLVTLGLAFGCSTIKDNQKEPSITNGEETYLELDEFSFTNQEVWDLMKIADGLNYLYQYIDEALLADTIANLTQDDIDQELLYTKYKTLDQDAIAEIQADAELEEEKTTQFNQNLVLLGFNPDDPGDLRAFVELNAARRKVAREFILNNSAPQEDAEQTPTSNLYIDAEKLQGYYETNNRGDVCVLDIRFTSTEEGNAVLDKFNLVPNYNTGWGLYTGDTPIEDVPVSDFTSDNTSELSDAGVFREWIKVYNYMNPNATIDEATTLDAYCNDYSSFGTRNYTSMVEDYAAEAPNRTYARYIFDVLGLEEDESRYATAFQTIGNFKLLSFVVEADTLTDFEDLTGPEIDVLREDYLQTMLTEQNISAIVDTYWEDVDFEIYDPTLKLQAEANFGDTFDNKGHDTLVAIFGDLEVSADDLFEYMNASIGSYYSLELTKRHMLLNSEAYSNKYGDSFDYLNSKDEDMVAHREELRTMKTNFSNDAFAQYGFSSQEYTWEEFIVVAFRSYNEATTIRDVYVLNALTPYLLVDDITYAQGEDYITEQVDNFFSLNATELLLYVDQDRDFEADTWTDIKATYGDTELATYTALKADLEDLILAKIDDGDTFADIVEAYNKGLIDDSENEWAPFKAYGFFIKTQPIQLQGGLNYNTVQGSDYEDLLEDFQRIYAAYHAYIDSSVDDVTEYYDDRIVESEDGLHFIKATEGTNFDQPTAVFDNSPNDNGQRPYSDGAGGTTIAPSQSQIELYIEIKMAQQLGESTDLLLPANVNKAIETYYGPLFQKYFSSSSYNIQSAQYILANNPQFTSNNTAHIAFIENAIDTLYEINFPDSYKKE